MLKNSYNSIKNLSRIKLVIQAEYQLAKIYPSLKDSTFVNLNGRTELKQIALNPYFITGSLKY
jgi:hypothetical protein